MEDMQMIFTFSLKTKFFCTETGKVIRKLNRESTPRIKKKMKKFKEWITQGKFSKDQAMNAYYSLRGYAKHCNCYKIIQKMDRYVKENYLHFVQIESTT